jgi:hypothetical protein
MCVTCVTASSGRRSGRFMRNPLRINRCAGVPDPKGRALCSARCRGGAVNHARIGSADRRGLSDGVFFLTTEFYGHGPDTESLKL